MDKNDPTSHKNALGDEVLRKIGRNVLLFQKIEGLLKYMVANSRMDGTTEDFPQRQQKRAEKITKQTMGGLVEDLTDNFLSDAGEPPKEPENLSQPWMAITIRLGDIGGGDLFESYREDMEQMVAARNDLIHHFLPRWQPDSIEGLMAAISYLDEQRDKVLPMIDQFESFAKVLEAGRQNVAAFLNSREGQREFELMWLQQSPLIVSLSEISLKIARPDGWTILAHAGSLVRKVNPEALLNLKERYGHSTLKQLLIASELFEIWDETLPKGGFRTLYREKQLPAQ